MSWKTIPMDELSEPVRTFLEQAKSSDGLVIRDEASRQCFRVYPFREVSPEERAAALERLGQLQQRTRQAMDEQGITEADIDRLLQEDD